MAKSGVSLAVDPGYDRVGIAIFEDGVLTHSECFSPERGEFADRLVAVHKKILAVVDAFHPTSLALETLFFSKNQKTAMQVAEARGVIVEAARSLGLTIHEYSPQSVKIAVTGVGNATKDGVIRMVERLIALPEKRRLDDEYDAIALGMAHVFHNSHHPTLRGR